MVLHPVRGTSVQELALRTGVLKETIMLKLDTILTACVCWLYEKRCSTCPYTVMGWLWLKMQAYSTGWWEATFLSDLKACKTITGVKVWLSTSKGCQAWHWRQLVVPWKSFLIRLLCFSLFRGLEETINCYVLINVALLGYVLIPPALELLKSAFYDGQVGLMVSNLGCQLLSQSCTVFNEALIHQRP